ncbi:hypothetical protein GGR56DRAFT_634945 [Xylariaceae sp. FL0804]|nr:hypothetical protein GGR56DRAFT_634945 [Xylariaceae sp. FL0804]
MEEKGEKGKGACHRRCYYCKSVGGKVATIIAFLSAPDCAASAGCVLVVVALDHQPRSRSRIISVVSRAVLAGCLLGFLRAVAPAGGRPGGGGHSLAARGSRVGRSERHPARALGQAGKSIGWRLRSVRV